MTKEDIQLVEAYAHIKQFVFDIVRYIEEGVPIANYFSKEIGDESLLNAQMRISECFKGQNFFGGVYECSFSVGDEIINKRTSVHYVIKNFVNVCFKDNAFARGVAIVRAGEDSDIKIYPVSFVNRNFIAV